MGRFNRIIITNAIKEQAKGQTPKTNKKGLNANKRKTNRFLELFPQPDYYSNNIPNQDAYSEKHIKEIKGILRILDSRPMNSKFNNNELMRKIIGLMYKINPELSAKKARDLRKIMLYSPFKSKNKNTYDLCTQYYIEKVNTLKHLQIIRRTLEQIPKQVNYDIMHWFLDFHNSKHCTNSNKLEKLSNIIIKHFKSNELAFGPEIMINPEYMNGYCESTRICFEYALEKRLLVKTDIIFDGKLRIFYIKGIFKFDGNVLAYCPETDELYAVVIKNNIIKELRLKMHYKEAFPNSDLNSLFNKYILQ